MQYFIGVVPPKAYKEKIVAFQNRWPNHWISKAVEPHVTLKAQSGLTPDEEWITRVKEVCKSIRPFDVTVEEPRFFFDTILYLSIESEQFVSLHERLVHRISPSQELIKKYFELEDFVPHMSIGKTFYGMSKEELLNMARLAEKELAPFPTFRVEFIRIYREVEPQIYEKYMDISLYE